MQPLKDPLPEIAAYRQQALYSTLCTSDDRAFCWYLAISAATHFSTQKKFFKPLKTFSIQDVASLARKHQAIEILSLKRKHNAQSSLSWMFSNNTRLRKPLEGYRYWIICSLEITSPHLEEEKKTVIQTFEGYPDGQVFLQEVLPYFEAIPLLEKASEKKDPLEIAILLHRAQALAFTAFHLVFLKHQRAQAQKEERKKLLLFLKKMVHCVEQELSLRKKILKATQQEKEEEVRYLTLAVTSWNSVKNCYQEATEELLKNSEKLPSLHQAALYGEEVAVTFQRLVETIITTSNKEAAGYLEHTLFLLKNAFDFRMQTRGIFPIFNQEFAPWLKQASLFTKRSALLWMRAAHTIMTLPSWPLLIRLWKATALYVEYQGHRKIQQIIARNNIQQAQHAFKKPLEEKKEYRKKITQALLAQQYEPARLSLLEWMRFWKDLVPKWFLKACGVCVTHKRFAKTFWGRIYCERSPSRVAKVGLAQQWRLAAEEAHFFFTTSKRNAIASLSEQEWKRFLEQFTSQNTFLLFLYQASEKEQREPTGVLAEAIAHSRYWMVRTAAEKNRSSFQEKNWLELHHSYKAACASEYLVCLNSQANQRTSHQVSLKAATACAQKVVSFRTKAVEATQAQQEGEAQQWTLAAYTMEQAAEGHIQFSEMAWWKPLAELAEEATAYRLQALETRIAGHSRRASYFEKAAFLLENHFDHELELRTSASDQETLPAWEKVFEQTKTTAALWGACGTTHSPWKHYFLKRKARQEEKEMRKKIMKILLQKISFCLPPEAFPDAATQEAWSKGKLVPWLEFSIPYAWIYQTWKLLRDAGMHYPLSAQPIEPGIVIGWGCYVMNRFGIEQQFPADLFLVDIIGDQLPHPNAHLYLVQNAIFAKYIPHTLFMPHWPQRQLIPRDPKRGDRFENVAFFGDPSNCIEELKSEAWKQRLLKEFGINFFLQGSLGWHDYSTIDALVAIRSFSKKRYFYKPATKLYNAWLAGVPFIGNPESAYAQAGTPGKDYLVATSIEELLHHLKRLKEDPSLRHQLVENGRIQATAFTQEATLERWKELVKTTLPAYAAKWQEKSALQRRLFFLVNKLISFLNFYLQS